MADPGSNFLNRLKRMAGATVTPEQTASATPPQQPPAPAPNTPPQPTPQASQQPAQPSASTPQPPASQTAPTPGFSTSAAYAPSAPSPTQGAQPGASTAGGAATLEAALQESAAKAGFGREVVEACGRLKEKIDTRVVTLMEMMNTALTVGLDGRAYSYDRAMDVISVNKQDPDIINRFHATEQVTRELEAAVKSMPKEIENLIVTLDETHAEFVSIVTGQPSVPVKRTFAAPLSIKPPTRAPVSTKPATEIEASFQAAMGATADRAAFLKRLVEASGRLKEQIDMKVINLLTMMNRALSKGVDGAYAYDEAADKILPIPQTDLIFAFTTTERVTRELADAVKDMPQEIEALIQELLKADEEFNRIIVEELNKK